MVEEKKVTQKEKEIYKCLVCKAMFKEAGMCPNCNVVLKKPAA